MFINWCKDGNVVGDTGQPLPGYCKVLSLIADIKKEMNKQNKIKQKEMELLTYIKVRLKSLWTCDSNWIFEDSYKLNFYKN